MVSVNPIGFKTIHPYLRLDTIPPGKRPLGIVFEQILEHSPSAKIELVIAAKTEIQIGIEYKTISKIHLYLGERKPLHPLPECQQIMPSDILVLETRRELESITEWNLLHIGTAVKDPVGHFHHPAFVMRLGRIQIKILVQSVRGRSPIPI